MEYGRPQEPKKLISKYLPILNTGGIIGVISIVGAWYFDILQLEDRKLKDIKIEAAEKATLQQTDNMILTRLQRIENDNDKGNANASLIKQLEVRISELEKLPATSNPNNASREILSLSRRIDEIDKKLSGLNNEGNNYGVQQIQGEISSLRQELSGLVAGEVQKQIALIDTSNSTDQRAQALAARVTEQTSSRSGDILWEFGECIKNVSDVSCHFTATNTAKKDTKACLSNIKAVTDKGIDYDGASIYIGNENGWASDCDVIAPLVSIKASFSLQRAIKTIDEKFQIVRLSCGAGCEFQMFDVPVGQ